MFVSQSSRNNLIDFDEIWYLDKLWPGLSASFIYERYNASEALGGH